MNPIVRIETIRAAGNIARYHTADLRRTQTNGQHTYNVLALVLAIDPDARRELLIAALLHDVPEIETGDIPAPVKWSYPELEEVLKKIEAAVLSALDFPALSDEERHVLKSANLLEGAYFCVELFERGDQKARDVCRTYLDAFWAREGALTPTAERIARHIEERWFIASGGRPGLGP